METQRPFAELNIWQRIYAEYWGAFTEAYAREHGREVPGHWEENVRRMLSCGDIGEGYYEYYCEKCGGMKKVGFTCKSRLCLRCFKKAVDDWLAQVHGILFEGVVHRQIVLTVPKEMRGLINADEGFMKAYMDAGAKAVKELIEEWRPKKKIKIGMMSILQLHGRAGNYNPHLHFVVSEGGIDREKQWQDVNYFDTKKLRKKWQYEVLTALRKAIKGTKYAVEWREKLGMMFDKYQTGFDCDCMPEKGPVERLVIYLFKYVSSPPISLRRIEKYDGQNVTYWYKDHRRGLVKETLSAVEFIGRMVRHLPPKGFRMVRYYGIYARPVRNKIHALVADALKVLVRKAEQIAQRISFFRKIRGENKGQNQTEDVGGHEECGVSCPHCGHGKMKLLRIWSKKRGMIYDASSEIGKAPSESGSGVIKQAARRAERNSPQQPVNNSLVEQLAFAF
jgi:hypothetical protein